MKVVQLTVAGQPRYLAFTGGAMFAIRDEFGGVTQLMDDIKGDTKESFATTCKAAALMMEQGELARRAMGYDATPMVTAEMLEVTAMPSEIAAIKLAIPVAISLGFGREVEQENNEIDLGLMELNQKKTN